jgi:hypothetical protein
VLDLELLARSGGKLDVYQRGAWLSSWRDIRQEVTCRVWAVGDEGEDLGDESLLDARFLGTGQSGSTMLNGVC